MAPGEESGGHVIGVSKEKLDSLQSVRTPAEYPPPHSQRVHDETSHHRSKENEMNDINDPEAPEDFDDHVTYLGELVVKATADDDMLRQEIFRAIEDLVTNVDGGPWEGCRVGWTSEIPDSPESIDGITGDWDA